MDKEYLEFKGVYDISNPAKSYKGICEDCKHFGTDINEEPCLSCEIIYIYSNFEKGE